LRASRGSGGVSVIAEGTPAEVALAPKAFTVEYLRPVLEFTMLAAD